MYPFIYPSIHSFISIHSPIHSAPQIVSEARHIFSDPIHNTFRLLPSDYFCLLQSILL